MRYRQAIGGLLYLTTCSRHDMAFVVNRAAKKCVKPTEKDWQAVMQIFGYLNETREFDFWMTKSDRACLERRRLSLP